LQNPHISITSSSSEPHDLQIVSVIQEMQFIIYLLECLQSIFSGLATFTHLIPQTSRILNNDSAVVVVFFIFAITKFDCIYFSQSSSDHPHYN
jgi:hypothetical protein